MHRLYKQKILFYLLLFFFRCMFLTFVLYVIRVSECFANSTGGMTDIYIHIFMFARLSRHKYNYCNHFTCSSYYVYVKIISSVEL